MKIVNKPILLVEDDQVDIMTVLRSLKEIRVTNPVVNKENGEDALDYLREHHQEAELAAVAVHEMAQANEEVARATVRTAERAGGGGGL